MKFDRRTFLRTGLAGLGAAVGGSALGPLEAWAAKGNARPGGGGGGGGKTPTINHIVVVCMENRSFDHYFGSWLPGADGLANARTLNNPNALLTYPLGNGGRGDFTGCGHNDPDHSYTGGRTEYDSGAMDGFLTANSNDAYCLGYYEESDRPFFNSLARNFTTMDCYFSSILAETFPNRMFLHCAQTDRLYNTTSISTLPTIWDRLAAAGISRRYYYQGTFTDSFLSLWLFKYSGISASYSQFLSDCANNRLPAVAYVEPKFNDNNNTGNDDHPHADVRAGDAFLSQTYSAIASSRAWSSTVLIIIYDEWGGFFDHVVPPRVVAPNNVDTDKDSTGKVLLGFRVPVVIVSPWTRGTDPVNTPRLITVSSFGVPFEHSSILKLIESRFGLQPLTARDASSEIGNLRDVLDMNNYNAKLPALSAAATPEPVPCTG